MTEAQKKLLEKIKKWAEDNYEKGGDTIVECYSDEEILAEFKSLKQVKEFCGVRKEREDEIRSTIW